MGEQSIIRSLDKLHPKVKQLAEQLIQKCKEEGMDIGISETYRTVERQNYLYEQGRSRKGNIVTNARGEDKSSYHQWGLAFDIYNNVKGDEYNSEVINKAGIIGEKLGLEWGGHWRSFKDGPHFQYTFGLTIRELKEGKSSVTDDTTENAKENSNENTEYKNAVKDLMDKNIITVEEKWYPEANTEFVEELIRKMMPYIVNKLNYEEHIKILKQIGILSNIDIWPSKKYSEEDVESLIKKVVHFIKK
ncbi:MAG: M15 family metallopeptidase [Cellulosilyticaceae bacterium]